jgi:hypothetical protein
VRRVLAAHAGGREVEHCGRLTRSPQHGPPPRPRAPLPATSIRRGRWIHSPRLQRPSADRAVDPDPPPQWICAKLAIRLYG